jgi:glutamate formiminotransferase/formiminotetrahydrofolate cyclodeaminase
MNLTDYRRTPLTAVVEAVRQEAERHGVAILHSELVGLIPQQAMVDTAAGILRLNTLEPEQILETRLAEAQAEASSEAAFIERLAEATATPGGGAAAAYAAAIASALVGMVARLTEGKKKYAEVEPRMRAMAEAADDLRRRLTAAAAKDSAAFEGVLQAMRLPQGSEPERTLRSAAIEQATRHAASVPLEVALDATLVAELGAEAAELGNVNAISDAASAVALARAALQAAALNVRINAKSLADPSPSSEWERALEAAADRVDRAEHRTAAAVKLRAGLG